MRPATSSPSGALAPGSGVALSLLESLRQTRNGSSPPRDVCDLSLSTPCTRAQDLRLLTTNFQVETTLDRAPWRQSGLSEGE